MTFKVQVVYRNYIPLNSPYSSLWLKPPEGVEFSIPPVKAYLRNFYPIYRKFGDLGLVKWLVRQAQPLLFAQTQKIDACDAYFFVGMLPAKPLKKPYYIDIEHASALHNFLEDDATARSHRLAILEVLSSPMCRGIVPLSQAAARSLQSYLGNEQQSLASKTKPIYPAIAHYQPLFGPEPSKLIPGHSRGGPFELLFVGKEPVGKGLYEVLDAFDRLIQQGRNIRLNIVTIANKALNARLRRVRGPYRLFPPRFSTRELMVELMSKCDLFVMPTHLDSFGMVYLEALSAGTPVIATSQFALPEIVKKDCNGILLEHPALFLDREGAPIPRRPEDLQVEAKTYQLIVDGLVKHIAHLAQDHEHLQFLRGNTGLDFAPGQRFSIEHRNQRLRELFGLG
jgi:glycosyltransferase involved in cell wall biosynthesis